MSVVEHTQALRSGAKLSQYEIQSVLGSGGFGITYLARDTMLDASVAIKEYLPSELAIRDKTSRVTALSTTTEPDFRWGLHRFLDEARVLAKFRHPNIVHVFQVFETNQTAYIVMEYAKGEPLSVLLQQRGALSESETRGVLLPIMDGLTRVHQHGFLHRDIKPGNIIMRDDGGPALIDFGAARQAIETKSRSITSIVTEGYAPLEQYDPNGNQGPWTDIYALGAVAYKCITGKTPPTATSRVRNDPLVPFAEITGVRCSPEFAEAVRWAMALYEEDRPQTIEALSQALVPGKEVSRPSGAWQAQSSDATIRVAPGDGVSRASIGALAQAQSAGDVARRSRRLLLGAGAALALLVVVFVGLRLISDDHSNRGRTAASPGPATASSAPAKAAEPMQRAAPPAGVELSGAASVIDTGTLSLQGQRVQLAGIQGIGGSYAQTFAKTLAEFGNAVTCDPTPGAGAYACSIAVPGLGRRVDLSKLVLVNGSATTTAAATADQKQQEATARAAGRGVWASQPAASD